jgi:hypothetical protein
MEGTNVTCHNVTMSQKMMKCSSDIMRKILKSNILQIYLLPHQNRMNDKQYRMTRQLI